MSVAKESELQKLVEQLLKSLLLDSLKPLGAEGEYLQTTLNATILRCLENCNKTSILCAFFNLLRKYKNNSSYSKLPGLIITCLAKLLNKMMKKVISELDIERVLHVIRLYLLTIDHDEKTANDDKSILVIKLLMDEIVKSREV